MENIVKDSKTNRIRVAHDLKDLNAEEEVIMTLKDEEIIKNNDYNDFQDTLENDVMTSNFKAEFNQKLRNKLLNNMNDPESDILEGKILPQYDEHKPEKEGFYLESDNLKIVDDENGNFLDRINKKLGKKDKQFFDLNIEKKVASEYMTHDEFKKRKKKRRKDKKKDLKEGLGEKSGDFSFLRELEEEISQEANDNLKKRGTNNTNNIEEEILNNQRKKLKTYQNVVESATNLTKANSNFEDGIEIEEDDHEELTRLLKNAKKKAESQAKRAEERLKEIMTINEENKEEEEQKGVEFNENEDHFEEVKNKVKEQGMDFEKSKRNNLLTLGNLKDGRTSVIDIMLPSERYKIKEEEEINVEKYIKKEDPKETKEKDDHNETSKETQDEVEIQPVIEDEDDEDVKDLQNSTVAALNLFRKRGMLSKDKTINYVGRSNDVKFHREMERVGGDKDRIRLEYRDKRTGRLMTQKEAFNDMCRTFHNIRPSKKKQAKMIKRQQAGDKGRYTNPTDMNSYKLMKKVQEFTNLPYVDLSKKM